MTLSYPPPLFLKSLDTGAISELFADQPIAIWLAHSLFVALITVVITLVFAIFGAYLLGRLNWHGKLLFGFLLLFTQMMPAAMIVVPMLQLYRNLHWTRQPPGALVDLRRLRHSARLVDPQVLLRQRPCRTSLMPHSSMAAHRLVCCAGSCFRCRGRDWWRLRSSRSS